ncbi:MAG: 1-deoxy-D-xylulose-5-phosphate reductoisomerase [bacterium]|nr:1-deoxy-D-xylulose-5-phosphate reductoisomerase [bacterium]
MGNLDYSIERPVDLAVLGSTGSIGRQTLDIAAKNRELVNVSALSTNSSVDLLVRQALEFDVGTVAIADESQRGHVALAELPSSCKVLWGASGIEEIAATHEAREGNLGVVLDSIVGIAGLRVSHATLSGDSRLALANKESLVVGGELLMPMVSPGQLIPVDSEHSAIFQCFEGERPSEMSRIWITASGGPFRGWTRAQLAEVTVDQALAHPTWNMGAKITIDSSTLMNKGFEVIEAHHLFNCDYDRVSVVVHPQSCIHSMVEFADGSVKAHLGVTDMRIPIQYALSYPARWKGVLEPLDFTKLGSLTFEAPDLETFGCLRLAIAAGREGGTATTVLNAASEVAVAAFLAQRCGFLDIEAAVEDALGSHASERIESLDHIEAVDDWARAHVRGFLGLDE